MTVQAHAGQEGGGRKEKHPSRITKEGLKGERKARQCLICNGGAEGDRTLGLMTASHALSQLSYSPMVIYITAFP